MLICLSLCYDNVTQDGWTAFWHATHHQIPMQLMSCSWRSISSTSPNDTIRRSSSNSSLLSALTDSASCLQFNFGIRVSTSLSPCSPISCEARSFSRERARTKHCHWPSGYHALISQCPPGRRMILVALCSHGDLGQSSSTMVRSLRTAVPLSAVYLTTGCSC